MSAHRPPHHTCEAQPGPPDRPMRALNVVWGPFPDIRLNKTGRLLGEAGWQVDVLCLRASGGDWEWGRVIEAALPTALPQRLLFRLAFQLRRDPTAFPWRHRVAFERAMTATRYDVVQWNDLPGVLAARSIVDRHGSRLVLDMHENYADNMWSTERDLDRPSWLYGMNDWLRYESKAVDAVDHVLVNIEEMGQRLVGMHGIAPGRITVVRNAEPPEVWQHLPEDKALAQRFAGKLVLSFISSCSRHRGMDVVIRALPRVLAAAPDTVVVIVGDGNGLPGWKALVQELGVAGHVHFEGRVPFARALAYYRHSHIGLIPHHKYAQTDNGIPHKYAQNLMAGLPIVVSSCHALERLTRELKCGVVFAAGDPGSAADAILELRDHATRSRLAGNGREAATAGVLGWDRMRRDLVAAYGKAMGRSAAQPQTVVDG